MESYHLSYRTSHVVHGCTEAPTDFFVLKSKKNATEPQQKKKEDKKSGNSTNNS